MGVGTHRLRTTALTVCVIAQWRYLNGNTCEESSSTKPRTKQAVSESSVVPCFLSILGALNSRNSDMNGKLRCVCIYTDQKEQ